MRWIILTVMAILCAAGVVLLLRLGDRFKSRQRWELLQQLGAAMVAYRQENKDRWPEDMDVLNRETDGLVDRIESAYGQGIDRIFAFFPEARRKNEMLLVDKVGGIAVFADGHLESLAGEAR